MSVIHTFTYNQQLKIVEDCFKQNMTTNTGLPKPFCNLLLPDVLFKLGPQSTLNCMAVETKTKNIQQYY
jgi:hypothetical protein